MTNEFACAARSGRMVAVNMWLQWILALFVRSKGGTRLRATDVARQRFRVWPTDVDMLGHMNNGRYLSYMDLARTDLTNRAGFSGPLQAAGIYAVVGQSTIAYRKSLDLWVQFDIETSVLGADERAIYIEQRFVVDGEIYARGVVQGRFIERGKGTASIERVREVLDAAGVDNAMPEVPEKVLLWVAANKLPSTRTPAPSTWRGDRTPR